MRKFFPASILVFVLLLFCNLTNAQDFSNKGKESWSSYSYHVGMVNAGGPPTMTLYITSDQNNTAYNVEIFGGATIASGTLNAGNVISVNVPVQYYIDNEGSFTGKAVRVTATKPVVVYSYITRSAASGATVCLPTPVLGKEYYSVNFTQVSNETNSNSFFTIVAVEDNTTVEITPSAATKNGWVAGTTYTVNLNKGQIYQVLGTTSGNNGGDLTGSHIRSVSGVTGGCKKIAVYSGSGKIRIPASCGQNSSDNLYQQLYPVVSWGKKYLTVPSFSQTNNYFRISKSGAGNVYLNGTLIPAASFINGFYYEFRSGVPNLIEADVPICVTQYFTSQSCEGNGTPFDPDMIVLNPVEQNIDKVTLVSSNMVNTPPQHHIHVIMRNGGTGMSSFKLDGNAVTGWQPHPADPSYSYIYLSNVAQGYHTLASDSGFNAIAYGYANFETYGYSAGANVKDLYQYVTVANDYATVDFPAACKGSPFALSMTFPYQPTEISWQFNGLFPDVTIPNPVATSTSVVNGRTLYKYSLPGTYTAPITIGTYPIKVLALNPTTDGCNGTQEIDYELQVYETPVANFNFTTNGCLTTPVSFTDNSTNLGGRPIAHWYWNFGDGGTVNDQASTTHTFGAAGTYDVKYTVITDVGCKADTVIKLVTLTDPPIADFTPTGPYCANKTITLTDQSTVAAGAVIAKWYWNFGDGSPLVTATSNVAQTHTYTTSGTFTVSLQVETASGCQSVVFNNPVTVSPNPVVDFNLPDVCLPSGAAQFNSLSTIADGSQNLFNYVWNFGDGSPAVGGQNPVHNYAATGPYNVLLTVTSNNGCTTAATKTLTTIYTEPKADFTAPAEICIGGTINFTDQSTAAGSAVTQWNWNFGDLTTSTDKNPVKTFNTAGTYTVTLSVTSAIGCSTISAANIATRTVVVNSLPAADFTTSLPGCAGQNIQFNNTSVANAGNIIKWNWSFGDASTAVFNNGNSFTHTYTNVNTYTVTLQVETNKGCISTVRSTPVIVNPVPIASFVSPEVCVSDVAAPFIDASSIASGTVAGWEWNFGDANANAANPNISTLQNPGHQYTQPGTYTAQLIATSNAGCKDTVQQSFTVNGAVLTPRFTIENTTALCSNKAVIIKDASQINAGSIIRVEIYWDANDLSVNTIDNMPIPGKIYTHSYPEFGNPATRTYRVRYDVYSGIVCVSSYTQDVTILATPTLSFSAVDAVCSNEAAFQLTPLVQLTNGLPGSGSFTGAGVAINGLFTPSVAGAGTHPIVYIYTGSNGCTNSVSQNAVVNPTPVANAGPDKVVLEGGFVALTPVLITDIPVSYAWTPGTGLSNAAIAGPLASPLTDFTYTLTVTSDKGCTTSDEVFVKLLKTPVIPNIFSPNGDGIHDRWVIEYLESYPGCVVEIFNRYGQQIYKVVNYTTAWDGKINGKEAPIGTYYYVIDPKNGRKPITGFVDIIR